MKTQNKLLLWLILILLLQVLAHKHLDFNIFMVGKNMYKRSNGNLIISIH
jgi:hypothetical protein